MGLNESVTHLICFLIYLRLTVQINDLVPMVNSNCNGTLSVNNNFLWNFYLSFFSRNQIIDLLNRSELNKTNKKNLICEWFI